MKLGGKNSKLNKPSDKYTHKTFTYLKNIQKKTGGLMTVQSLEATLQNPKLKGMRKDDDLPAIVVAAIFKGGRRKLSHIQEFTGFMDVDIDAKDNAGKDLTGVFQSILVASEKHIYHVRVSIGGKGLKLIVKIPKCKTVEEYKGYHRAFQKYMFKKWELVVDRTTDDPTRAQFLSYDEYPYFNADAAVFKEQLEVTKIEYAEVEDAAEPDEELSHLVAEIRKKPELVFNYYDWRTVCQGIKHKYGEKGREAFFEISEYGALERHEAHDIKATEKLWDSTHREGVAFGSIIHLLASHGVEFNAPSPTVRLSHKEVEDKKSVETPDEFWERLKAIKLGINEEIEQPHAVVKIGSSPVMSIGEISTIIGKAKSMKSTFLSSLVTGHILGGNSEDIVGDFPPDKEGVLIIDTEQGRYHVSQVRDNIKKVSGIDTPPVHIYPLRPFDTADRLRAFEELIKRHHKEVSLVILDGARDLVFSINSEEEATQLADIFLELSTHYEVHISTVLHQNKGDDHARGHVGSELMNKSESMLKVEPIEDMPGAATMTPEFTRNMPPPPISFQRNDDGIRVIPTPKKEEKKAKPKPQELVDGVTNHRLIEYVFTHATDEGYLTKKAFDAHLKEAFGFSREAIKLAYSQWQAEGWIYEKPAPGKGRGVHIFGRKL